MCITSLARNYPIHKANAKAFHLPIGVASLNLLKEYPVPSTSTLAILVCQGKSSRNAHSGSSMNLPKFPGSGFRPALLNAVCAPLCCKNLCRASCFAPVAGSWGQQIQELARRGCEGNASPGAHSEVPGGSLGAARQQQPNQKSGQSAHV